jgi:hypothetical protein
MYIDNLSSYLTYPKAKRRRRRKEIMDMIR